MLFFDPILGKLVSGDAVTYTTATRPAASDVEAGTPIWNSDTGKPEWSNGTDWITVDTNFKGYFANEAAIIAAYPTGTAGWYCLNTDTNTVWFWDTDTNAWFDSAEGGLVTSVFGRLGDITAQANDYTWAQIDKTLSSIADFTTKKANLLDWDLSADITLTTNDLIINSTLKLDGYDATERIIRNEDRTSNLAAGDSGKFTQYYSGASFNDAILDGVLKNSLTAAWKFENGALTTDSIGSNTLTNNNAIVNSADGKDGYCADLDASSTQYFDIAAVGSDLKPTTKLLVACWFKIRSYAGNEMIIFKAGTTGTYYIGWGFYDGGGSTQTSEIQMEESNTDNIYKGSTNVTSYVPLDTWTHFAYVADGTNVRIFLNNTQVDSVGYDGTIREISSLVIGANGGGAYPFDGLIDEFYFYKDPDLSAGVANIVSALYNDKFLDTSVKDYRISQNLQEGTDGNITVANDLIVSGELSIAVYSQNTEPTLGADTRMAIWEDADDSDRIYLVYRRGSGDQVSVELT